MQRLQMMTEDASAARSARGARPLDLKARIRSQRSGEGKGGEFRGRAKFGWMPLSQEVRGRRCPSNHPPDDIHRLPTLIAFLLSLGRSRGVARLITALSTRPTRTPPGRVVSEER